MSEQDEIFKRIVGEIESHDLAEQEDVEECQLILEENAQPITTRTNSVTLEQVDIEHFKMLERPSSLTVESSDTVIHGRNSMGKTSLLEAIRFNLLGLQQKERIRLADPVTEGYSQLGTAAIWDLDETDYLVRRVLKDNNGSYERHDKVTLIEEPTGLDVPFGESPVDDRELIERVGFSQADHWNFGRYNVFSLFFLMSANYKSFLGWQRKNDLLDLAFGIDLSNVLREVERRLNEEYEVSEKEESAAKDLVQARSNLDRTKSNLEEVREARRDVGGRLDQRRDELDTVASVLNSENELDELRAEQGRLQRRRNRFESEILELRSDLRQVEQDIARYEEHEFYSEIHPMANELRQLVGIPNRCPVCANEVSGKDRQRLLKDHACPLCSRDVEEARLDSITETEDEDTILREDERQSELERLQDVKREQEGEIRVRERQIEDLNEQIEEIESAIETSDISDYVNRRDDLETEISELESKATELQVQVNAQEEELKRTRKDIKEYEKLKKERDRKAHKREILHTFKKQVNQEVRDERFEVQAALADIMTSLMEEHFTEGLFADSIGVKFPREDSYDFVIRRESGEHKPSTRKNAETTEGVLQSLLFHTAVLKLLSKNMNSIPIRLFMVDAPFSNEPDDENAADIMRLLRSLPMVLDKYQILMTVANSEHVDLPALESDYKLVNIEQLVATDS